MLFNSLSFILLFLPLALTVFYLLARLKDHRWAQASLVVFSLFFYMWWSETFVLLLVGSAIFNFTCGLFIFRLKRQEKAQKLLLVISVAANLLLLFNYKYLIPVAQFLRGFGLDLGIADEQILLPLGISFFTFTQIGYLLDCQAGLVKRNDLLSYLQFVTFFPHLIAGPILHHREMIPQFSDSRNYRFQAKNLAAGLSLFIMGLAKKTLIAEYFSIPANEAFDHIGNLTTIAAWYGAISYSMQLYFDFSAYSDMAIGLALLFNLRFPANFNSPYKSALIIDFWQRWHMTLTRYLMLYVYTPIALRVSRYRQAKGLPMGKDATRQLGGFASLILLPTFVTMSLIGLWHGAGSAFLVFGLLHACYLSVNHAWRIWKPKFALPAFVPVRAFYVVLTYIAVLITLIFFRSASVTTALGMIENMFGLNSDLGPNSEGALFVAWDMETVLALIFALVWFAPNSLQIMDRMRPTLSKIGGTGKWLEWRPSIAWGCVLGALGALALVAVGGTNEFLYFRF